MQCSGWSPAGALISFPETRCKVCWNFVLSDLARSWVSNLQDQIIEAEGGKFAPTFHGRKQRKEAFKEHGLPIPDKPSEGCKWPCQLVSPPQHIGPAYYWPSALA